MSEYTIDSYGAMIADQVRVAAYASALDRAVTPGTTVLDIGTGAGYFALLAARLGARHVYAIETSDAVQVARDCAVASGLADRVSFVHQDSRRTTLPERADVIVSDLRGVLPLHGLHLAVILDARRRHLRPGGILIPARDTVRLAVATLPDEYDRLVAPWDGHAVGLDLSPGRNVVLNRWHRVTVTAEQLVTAPADLFVLDYQSLETTKRTGQAEWIATGPGEAHGLVAWFEAELAPGVAMSTAPGAPALIYGQAFFPWLAPCRLRPGDRITANLSASLVGEHYEWQWHTTVADESGTPRATFHQATLHGLPLSLDKLRRRSAGAQPVLTDEGQALAAALASMNGVTSLGEIAETLAARMPDRFSSPAEWLDFVAEVSARFAR